MAAHKAYEQALEKINSECQAKIEAAEKDAAVKRKAAAAPLIAKLNAEVAAAVKAGDLDAAINWRKQIKAVQDGEKVLLPIGKQKLMGRMAASAEASYVIYINGKRALEGGTPASVVPVRIGVGDVITVRAAKGVYGSAFACLIVFPDAKRQITTNTVLWNSYKPKDSLRWYEPAQISQQEKAKLGRDELVRPAIGKLVSGDQQAVWGTGDVCYLTLTVTEESFQELTAVPVIPQ